MRFTGLAYRTHRLRASVMSRAVYSISLLMMLCALSAVPAYPQATTPPLLTSAVLRGVSLYDPAALFPLYREYLGKPITRANVTAIVTGLADRYERDGYPRPRVTLDDELASLGILRINVFEVLIADVTIDGNPGPHRATLERIGAGLATGTPIQQRALQDSMRRMRALPGLSLSASTERHTDVHNVYRLAVDTDFQPVAASVRVTNRGTKEVGPRFAVGHVIANGLLHGRLSAGVLFAAASDYEEFRGLGVLASASIGDRGATLSMNAYRSRVNPDDIPVDLHDLSVRDRVTLSYSTPVLVGLPGTTALKLGLESTDLEIEYSRWILRDESLRLFKAGLHRQVRHGDVDYAGSIELIKGLGGLGSGLVALDLANDPRRADFLAWRLSGVRLARFASVWSLRVDVLAQQSAYSMPFAERFRIGGERLGRGFEVAAVAGDQGLGGKVELRRAFSSAPAGIGRPSAYAFYDIGVAWRHDVPGRESAATAGFGLALEHERITASVEIAEPLTHPDVEGRRDAKLFLELALSW